MSAERSIHGMFRLYQHCNQSRAPLSQYGTNILSSVISKKEAVVSNKTWTLNCRSLHFQHSSLRPFTPLRLPPRHSRTSFPSLDCVSNRKMSTLHLVKGSACPPLKDGVVRLYNMKFCPFAQRALLVAEAKGIKYEIVNCNLKDKPEWLFVRNPEGKVPIYETKDGKVLYESLIVADYLDEIYSQRPLHSKDAYAKAIDRIFIERFSSVISLFYKVMFAIRDSQMDVAKEVIAKFVDGLKPFEEELIRRGSLFFGGDQPGMVDYMIWPWIERIPVIKSKLPDLFDYDEAKKQNPNLENWRQAMKKDSAVSKYLLSPELHQQFIDSFLAGNPNYDL